MNTALTASTWTWADQISTWRFWGLVLAYLLIVSVGGAFLNRTFIVLPGILGLDRSTTGGFMAVQYFSTAFGILAAWLAMRWKPVSTLIILACVKVLAVIFICFAGSELVAFVGCVMSGIATGGWALVVPAIIVGGRGSAESFVVSFGLISVIGIMAITMTEVLMGQYMGDEGRGQALIYTMVPVALGTVALLTAGNKLFIESPPDRGYAFTPVGRRPFEVALLFLVPFYAVYWLYRVHGEVASIAPSRQLLSPRGALWCTLFVPFVGLVALISILDTLNNKRVESGKQILYTPGTIVLWVLLFPPVAGAKIQSALNQLLAE
jgi:hypothetical protein